MSDITPTSPSVFPTASDVATTSSDGAPAADGPLTVILLDGDRDVFRMDLVKDGFAGGIRAAAELFELTQQYLQAEGLFGNGIIMCFIFLNRVGLGDYLEVVGLLRIFAAVQGFIRGFVNSEHPFYMMDTGDAKESADEQIHILLRTFSGMSTCQRVLLGGTHDKRYHATIEQLAPAARSKVVMVRTTLHEPHSIYRSENITTSLMSAFVDYLPAVGGGSTTAARESEWDWAKETRPCLYHFLRPGGYGCKKPNSCGYSHVRAETDEAHKEAIRKHIDMFRGIPCKWEKTGGKCASLECLHGHADGVARIRFE